MAHETDKRFIEGQRVYYKVPEDMSSRLDGSIYRVLGPYKGMPDRAISVVHERLGILAIWNKYCTLQEEEPLPSIPINTIFDGVISHG